MRHAGETTSAEAHDRRTATRMRAAQCCGLYARPDGGVLGVSEPQFTALLDNTSEARERITKAKVTATARVANSLFKRATEDADVAAQRFWLQSQGGPAWQPNTPQTSVTVNLSAALKDISKVIDGNASETGHKTADRRKPGTRIYRSRSIT